MDSATYRHLMGQIKKSCSIPHYKFPGHNLVSLETLSKVLKEEQNLGLNGFLDSFPCYDTFDYCVHSSIPLFFGIGLNDAAADVVKKKKVWERKLKTIRVSNIDRVVKCIRKLKDNEATKVTRNMAEYINHFHNDPEPEFQGSYNWLYTGGNLCAIEDHGETTLISADYFDKRPGFNVLKLDDKLEKIEYKTSSHLKTASPVLQITGKTKKGGIVVCIRQKNYLSLYTVDINNSFSSPVKLWSKKVLGSKLLISMGLNESCKEVLITDSKYDVHVFDVETKKEIYSFAARRGMHLLHDRDAWSQGVFTNSGMYLAVRNSLSVLDFRVFDTKKLVYDISTATNDCEEICSVESCPSEPHHVYLGTTHHLLQVDMRNGKTVQRWTHLMRSPPQFLSSLNDNGREFVALQSHQVGETLGISNEYVQNEEGVSFLSRSLPCLLDGIKDSLKLARFHGVCLSPFVAKRFDFSVTGIQCIKNSEGRIHLFTENSGGDIFLSKITAKSGEMTREEDVVLNTMGLYESHFESLDRKDPPKTSFEWVDMSPLVQKLRSPRVKSEEPKEKVSWRYHEMFSPESLCFYKDDLAQQILHVWGYKNEESDNMDATISADTKVLEWMERI